ncbi:MAG: hypothetical protein HY242_08895 [Afipia sp.]|nr:hypothetical protein [Afipia sp.]
MDIDLDRVKDLISKRDEIDVELVKLFSGKGAARKPQQCSHCNQEGHTARNCPGKTSESQT